MIMAWGPFHEIPGAYAVLQSKGVWRQAKVYRRDNMLFAGHGSGFIRLYKHGTSLPGVTLDSFDLAGAKYRIGDHGRLELC